MRPLVSLLILGVGLYLVTGRDEDQDFLWNSYKKTHNKEYRTEHEERMRRAIWDENRKHIEEHNREADLGKFTYWLGINQFSDQTFEEVIRSATGGYGRPNMTMGSTYLPPNNLRVPSEVDWRKHGYVTPVKNQGRCGSCWAFSTIASLEGQHFKKSGKLVSLSEQNLVDCSGKYKNNGCKGGRVDWAFKYIIDNGGIDTEEAYPYTGKDGSCKYQQSGRGAVVKTFTKIPENEKSLQAAVASVGPISACIYVNEDFMHYKSGVFNSPNCRTYWTNHCILVAGYGTSGSDDYWLVKNSWGTSWGMDGYIWMSRNKGDQCGIDTDAYYPNL